MMEYAHDARQAVEDYLQRVKAYVHAAGSADPEEVAGNVSEHIERELAESQQPVSLGDVIAVLERLGDPKQWVEEDEISWWRKILLRIHTGPNDWQLAYLTLGLLVAGFLLGWIFQESRIRYDMSRRMVPLVPQIHQDNNVLRPGVYMQGEARHPIQYEEFNYSLFVFFTVISFLTARAALAAAGDPELVPAGQKYLIYPSLLLVYLPLAIGILIWASICGGGLVVECVKFHRSIPIGTLSRDEVREMSRRGGTKTILFIASIFFFTGLWWSILGIGLQFRKLRRVAAKMFYPFVNPSRRGWAVLFLVVGTILFLVGAITVAVLDANGDLRHMMLR